MDGEQVITSYCTRLKGKDTVAVVCYSTKQNHEGILTSNYTTRFTGPYMHLSRDYTTTRGDYHSFVQVMDAACISTSNTPDIYT